MTDLALQLDSVGKTYKGFPLRDVSFELPRGCIMGLIGANGAGKTTILKLIMNLVRRDLGFPDRIPTLNWRAILDSSHPEASLGHSSTRPENVQTVVNPFGIRGLIRRPG